MPESNVISRNKKHDETGGDGIVPTTAPEGHSGPKEYVLNNHLLTLGQVALLFALTYLLFPQVLRSIAVSAPFSTTEIVGYTLGNINSIIYFGLFAIVLIIVHEAIHYVANQKVGLNPRFGYAIHWSFGLFPELKPYVVSTGAYISRKQNLIALASPLILIDVVALLGLLPAFSSTIEYYARVTLLLNTSLAIEDIYNSIRVSSHQSGTLFRNFDVEDNVETYYYPPLKRTLDE